MANWTGKTLIIADGSTRIGAAAARRAADAGAQIAVLEQPGRPVCEEVRAVLGEAAAGLVWPVDLAGPEAAQLLSERLDRLALPVGGLFYNYLPGFAMEAAPDLSPKGMDAYVDEMVRVFQCTQLLAKKMAAGGGGGIVYLGTLHDDKPFGGAAHSLYMGGLKNLSREAAAQYGWDGIHLCMIELGAQGNEDTACHTPCTTFYEGYRYKVPCGEPVSPEDAAQLALYLLEGQSRYINGAEIRMDGGLLLHYLDPLANMHAHKRRAVMEN